MTEHVTSLRKRLDLLVVAVMIAACLILRDVIIAAHAPVEMLARTGHDEIMRLVAIRDWMASGDWFDTTIDRVADGLSLHWSRYMDVPVVWLSVAFGWVMPAETAEGLAIVIWPTVLLLVFLGLTARAAGRLWGRNGAALAILGVILWETLGRVRFGPVRLDHHGAQVLLVLIMVLALMGMRRRNGLIAGLAGALSLAIGLEMLPAIALAGIFFAIRAVEDPEVGALPLALFGLSLAAGSAVLFAGQTPVADWRAPICDELGAPILGLCAIAAVASVAIAFSLGRIRGLVLRSCVTVGIGAAAAVVALPVLGPCFAGPYGHLPAEVQTAISTQISEARPAWVHLIPGNDHGPIFTYLMPALAGTALASVMLWRGHGTTDQRRAMGVLVAFGWLGVAGAFFQLRLLALAEPVVPLIIAGVGTGLIAAWRARPKAIAPKLALIAGLAAMLVPGAIFTAAENHLPRLASPAVAAIQTTPRVPHNHCRLQVDVVRSLDALPSSRLMAMGNLGGPVLLLTDHDILMAPYHRSEMAMRNLLLHGERDPDALHARLVETGADYLVLCRHMRYGDGTGYINELAQGALPAGYAAAVGPDHQLVVLEVLE